MATDIDAAKQAVVLAIGAGATVSAACSAAGRTKKTYENWRASDPEFRRAVDEARAKADKALDGSKDPTLYQLSFADWRKRFLDRATYPHMQNLIDVMEGRDPSWLHPSMTWEPASRDRIVMNIPVYHAKSQTVTVDWVTYKLCQNPNLQILIVSKKQEQAKKFLYQIKQRLTSNLYADLQMAYAGPEGFKGDVWSSNMIYLKGRDSDEKDPNVEAVGLGGQIYGSRADIIILDDCIVGSNAAQYENQITWIESEVENRVFDGVIAFVGTRLAPQDLYSEIIRGDRYMSGKSPWTYLAMPMVLEFAEDPEDWVTLWPKSHAPMDRNDDTAPGPDGMYSAWDGKRAAHTRASKPPRTFELVYQQRGTTEDATFHPTCVWGSVDRRRKPGPLVAGAWGHPKSGAEGMRKIVTIDPAGTGEAFILHGCIDRLTRKRWITNAWMGNHTTIQWYMERLEEIYPQYGIDEIVVERNGYANWLIHDERFMNWTRERGIVVVPHFTGNNKQDEDLGVTSLSTLFGSLVRRGDGGQFDHDGMNLIELPDPDKSGGIRALVEQLLAWQPGKSGAKLRMDGPMCLWFFELRCRVHTVGGGDKPPATHAQSRFLSPRAARRRGVIPVGF
ncbi:MAG TPA: hypothetical protein VFM86_03910 [Pedococcus sp.]|nr:hypothetical protein [Pedococcus sp.]